MKKSRNAPLDATDLKQYLATQDDFDLELFVSRTAQELEFVVTHGGSYIDPVTKKYRQFDIRAERRNGHHGIALAIECKNLSPAAPLLLSRVPRPNEDAFHEYIHARPDPDFHPSGAPPYTPRNGITRRIRGARSLYQPDDWVGKSIAQVRRTEAGFTGQDGDVYDKWTQAIASAEELIKQAEGAHHRHNTPVFSTFVIPVLVVSDGTVWVADYSKNGAREGDPQQVLNATLFVDRTYSMPPGQTTTLSHLHIYTRSGLEVFLKEITAPGSLWQTIFDA